MIPFSKLSDCVQINPRIPVEIRNTPPVEVTFLKMASVSEEGKITNRVVRPYDEVKKGFTYFEEGDVLLAKITPCMENGKAAHAINLPKPVGFGSTEFHVFRSGPNIFPRYLFYFLWSESFRKEAATNMAGAAGQKRVPTPYLKNLLIPLPPLDEQKRIAAVLDKADALRRQRKEALELTDKFLQSVFLDMFGNPVANTKNLPTAKLGDISKLERGKFTPRPRNDPAFFGGEYPFIQTGDITRSNGLINSWKQTLNEKGKRVSKCFPKGTVVIAIVGATIGETAIIETPVFCPDSIIGITPKEKSIDPLFLEYILRQWKKRLKEIAPDAARANLNLERLKPIPIICPKISDMDKFLRLHKALARQNEHLLNQSSLLENLFSSLQQRAFRGELDLSRISIDELAKSNLPRSDQPIKHGLPLEETYSRTNSPLKVPAAIRKILKPLDAEVKKGELIDWSPEYFKYRIIGERANRPFSFEDLMIISGTIFYDTPPYEEAKAIVFDMLESKPPLLQQKFNLKRKEVVLDLVK